MSNRIQTGKKTTRIGQNIVRAWFDTVINPLLSSLKIEQEFLEEKNWTWRFLPGRLESIRPIQRMISSLVIDNLEQFTEFYPNVKRVMDEHDDKLTKLLSECEDLHRALINSPALLKAYQRLTSPESLAKLEKINPTLEMSTHELFGHVPGEAHLEFLAENIINRTGDLPPYFSPSPLWNKHRTEFLAILNQPGIREHDKRTTKAGESLLNTVNRLIDLLKKMRAELSLAYDTPYVSAATVFAE